MQQHPENEAAFPVSTIDGFTQHGMTLRDWFATFAPQPTDERVAMERQFDRNRNPHNDAHKPRPRETDEIVAQLRYQYADAMLVARSGEVA